MARITTVMAGILASLVGPSDTDFRNHGRNRRSPEHPLDKVAPGDVRPPYRPEAQIIGLDEARA